MPQLKIITNLFTSLILNKVLDSQTLISRLKGNGDATTYCPDDSELKNGFESSKLVNLQSKGIIYLIESKIRPDNSSTALLGFNNYSLEHLMPKEVVEIIGELVLQKMKRKNEIPYY